MYAGEGILVNTMGVLIVFFSALVVFIVTHTSYKRLATVEDQLLLGEAHVE